MTKKLSSAQGILRPWPAGMATQARRREQSCQKAGMVVDNFHTSIPHSGTRSHLLNTTTRSHTRTPASGEEAAACFESRTRSVRHRLNAPRCVDQYQRWGLHTRFRSRETQVVREG